MDSDVDSTQEEEEENDIRESDFDEDGADMDSGDGTGPVDTHHFNNNNNNNSHHRSNNNKSESNGISSRIKSEHLTADAISEKNLIKAHQERLMMVLQQQALGGFIGASAAPWTPNLTAFTAPGSPGPLPLAISSLPGNGTTHGSNNVHSSSSPGGGSGSSGLTSGSSSGAPSSRQEHLEAGKGYTFEEQFKQLYELSDDPKRKEFLDDLFSFMQKKGQPVNRIPIMAKQVLDLYELYRLVVARGGLVEVINKKIWREITKGLNLPSSITSAAFTLRTQYMKYLYQYECEKEHLSSQDELQQAIDGNRREGRRSSYGHYAEMVEASRGHTRQINGHNSSGEEDNECRSMSSTPSVAATPTVQQEALNLQVKSNQNLTPPAKRFLSEEERFMNSNLPPAPISITGLADARSQLDNRAIVVSMEISGISYRGMLFAQSSNSHRAVK